MDTRDLDILTETVDGILYRLRKLEKDVIHIELTLRALKGNNEKEVVEVKVREPGSGEIL